MTGLEHIHFSICNIKNTQALVLGPILLINRITDLISLLCRVKPTHWHYIAKPCKAGLVIAFMTDLEQISFYNIPRCRWRGPQSLSTWGWHTTCEGRWQEASARWWRQWQVWGQHKGWWISCKKGRRQGREHSHKKWNPWHIIIHHPYMLRKPIEHKDRNGICCRDITNAALTTDMNADVVEDFPSFIGLDDELECLNIFHSPCLGL